MLEKRLENKQKRFNIEGEKVEVLKYIQPFNKKLLSIKGFISSQRLNAEIMNVLKRNKEEKQKANRTEVPCRGYINAYDFVKFKAIRVFRNAIKTKIFTINSPNDEQSQFARNTEERNFKGNYQQRLPTEFA